ncbi:MAG: hypothetical protein R3F58_14030 [Steroidobacteraceae bacterium]
MIYLVYRMKLAARSRRDLPAFWRWLEERERWFYRDLPMVKAVRWYLTSIGELYTLECWAAFEHEAALGEYRRAIVAAKQDAAWEQQRTQQEDWWEFLDSRLLTDVPCRTGFGQLGRSGANLSTPA